MFLFSGTTAHSDLCHNQVVPRGSGAEQVGCIFFAWGAYQSINFAFVNTQQ